MPGCITTSYSTFTPNLLVDRFQLLQLLGSGSFGQVYKALDTKPESPADPQYLAIKSITMPEDGSSTGEGYRREFDLQEKVSDHENIVSVHDIFEQDQCVYIVMELADGDDLFSAIVDKGMFKRNDELIKSVFVKIIDAVHHCHQKDGEEIRLVDFGLATDRRVCADFGCGSGPYRSPECIGKDTGNIRYSTLHNDIWSLGIIFFNLVTGSHPWTRSDSSDQGFAAYLQDQNSLQGLPISRAAHELLKRILKLNPLSRISLPVLRAEILAMDTFFAPEQAPARISLPGRLHVDVNVNVQYDSCTFSSEGVFIEEIPSWSSMDSDGIAARVSHGNAPPAPAFIIGSLSKSSSSSISSGSSSGMEVRAQEDAFRTDLEALDVYREAQGPQCKGPVPARGQPNKPQVVRTVRRRPNFWFARDSDEIAARGLCGPGNASPAHAFVIGSLSKSSSSSSPGSSSEVEARAQEDAHRKDLESLAVRREGLRPQCEDLAPARFQQTDKLHVARTLRRRPNFWFARY